MKNQSDILDLITKIQSQLIGLEAKLDTLINRSTTAAKPSPTPPVKERMMHKAICADCKKECSIPFKPSGDRPVYCQDCFSRRKVIKLSGLTSFQTPIPQAIDTPKPKDKSKKAVLVKKSIGKKKPVPKKK